MLILNVFANSGSGGASRPQPAPSEMRPGSQARRDANLRQDRRSARDRAAIRRRSTR